MNKIFRKTKTDTKNPDPVLNLSFNGGTFFLFLVGGGLNLSIPFLFEKTIEKVIRLCTVLSIFGDKYMTKDFKLEISGDYFVEKG